MEKYPLFPLLCRANRLKLPPYCVVYPPKGPKRGPKGPRDPPNGVQKRAPRPKSRFYNCNPRRKNGIFAFSKGGHRKKSLFEVLGPPFGPQKAQNGPQKAQIGPQKGPIGGPGTRLGGPIGGSEAPKGLQLGPKKGPETLNCLPIGLKGPAIYWSPERNSAN